MGALEIIEKIILVMGILCFLCVLFGIVSIVMGGFFSFVVGVLSGMCEFSDTIKDETMDWLDERRDAFAQWKKRHKRRHDGND